MNNLKFASFLLKLSVEFIQQNPKHEIASIYKLVNGSGEFLFNGRVMFQTTDKQEFEDIWQHHKDANYHKRVEYSLTIEEFLDYLALDDIRNEITKVTTDVILYH